MYLYDYLKKLRYDHSLSNMAAAPYPVPMHIDTIPLFFPVLSNSVSNVTIILAPVIPRGWPKAIAPPLGFNLSFGILNSLAQYMAWLAKASLISKISISDIYNPVFLSAMGMATAGPIPIISGGTPAT